MKKKLLITAAIAVLSTQNVSAAAQETSADTEKVLKTINQRTQALENQVSELKKEIAMLRQERVEIVREKAAKLREQMDRDRNSSPHIVDLGGAAVGSSPYIGIRSEFDQDPIVSYASVNLDHNLLEQRYKLNQQLKNLRGVGIHYPVIELSPKLEVEASYFKPYKGDHHSDIDLTAAKISAYLMPNSWLGGFLDIAYDNGSPAKGPRTSNSRLYMRQAFVTVGDLERSPFYATVGQLFVPFGRYSSFMASSPMIQAIGRTKARALVVGYAQPGTGIYSSAYTFKGDSNTSGKSQINNWGANLGYRFAQEQLSADVGISYINNIADAEGMQSPGSTIGGFSGFSSSKRLQHTVPALDVRGRIGYGPVVLMGEYLTTTRAFDRHDLRFNGQGARPRGYNVEAAYMFDLLGMPSNVAIGHAGTANALALNLPRQRYSVAFSMSPWKATTATLEYRQDKHYGKGTTAGSGQAADASPEGLGETAHAVIAQFSIYF